MKQFIVSMTIVSMILEHGGVHTKLLISPLLRTLDHCGWSHFKALSLPFHPFVYNASYLICMFLNFNENIKNDRKIIKIHK